jgi:hypothetical protein
MVKCIHRTVGEWPNTYTYSKALAEDMIQQKNKLVPVAIFRPSVGKLAGKLINQPTNSMEESPF